MVGADLANIVNEAALLAVRRGAESVELRDLEQAADRVTLGFGKKEPCHDAGREGARGGS